MAYKIEWYIPSRVIYLQVWDYNTIEEIERISEAMVAMLDEGTPLVHLIFDNSASAGGPTSIRSVSRATSFTFHPAMGWSVGVGETTAVSAFVMSMVARITRVRYRSVKSFDEAVALLKQQDQTVDWRQGDLSAAAM